jgi:RNA polymerase sigma-70 factor (ECF subfamily)
VGSLAAVFRDARPEALRSTYGADAALADELARLVADARASEAAVDEAAFVAAVALRVDPDAEPARALGGMRAGDLVLALACARGEPAALARFDVELREAIDRAAARFRDAPIQRDELRQAIRERLLVATDGALPRVASYQGRGDLRCWVRRVGTR